MRSAARRGSAMDPLWMAAGVLAVWRVTHLLAEERGPWDTLLRLRRAIGAWARALDCFLCLSLWVALPVAFAVSEGWLARLVTWPALSGGAILLQRLTQAWQPAEYSEDNEEGSDELLR
jgi:hypothetical protein